MYINIARLIHCDVENERKEPLTASPRKNSVKNLTAEYDIRYTVSTEKGVCTVDLSNEYIKNHIDNEVQERMCLRSLVDSLTELDGVESVQILIDGAKVKGFKHFDLSKPFSRGYI